MIIFWSWQSDREHEVCRYFVRDALEDAAALLADEFKIEERPTVDSDTQGVPGSPEIVATIFKKITAASVFIGDVTPVAKTRKGKQNPNPNVMIELGYAERALSNQRIITVANEQWYKGPETLPFNLRHKKGPITYKLAPAADKGETAEVRKILAERLRDALLLILASDDEETMPPARRASRDGDPSIWTPTLEPLRHNPWHGEGGEEQVAVIEGPRAYMRLIPQGWINDPPRRADLNKLPDNVAMWPLGRWVMGDGGVNENGLLRYSVIDRQLQKGTTTAAQLFRYPPEIWGWDSSIGASEYSYKYLPVDMVARNWANFLRRGLALLEYLLAKGPIEVVAGLTELQSLRWPIGENGSIGLDDRIEYSKRSSDWSAEDQLLFITATLEKISDAYAKPPFSGEQIRQMIA